MKRFFLFVVAALFCMTKVMAQPEWYGNELPENRYVDINKYVKGYLHFYDHYLKDETLIRGYTIYAIENRGDGCRFSKRKDEPYHYHLFPSSQEIAKKEVEKTKCKGTSFRVDVSDLVDACYKMGITSIAFAIEPAYYLEVAGELRKHSYYTKSISIDFLYCWLANYYEVELPRDNSTITAPTEVHYGDQMEVTANIKDIAPIYYRLQRSKDNKTWETLKSGRLEQEEAQEGKAVSYKSVVTGNGNDKLYYRLINSRYHYVFSDDDEIIGTKLTGINDTVYYEVDVLYQLSIIGDLTWAKKGTPIILPDIGGCAEWKISCALPLEKDEDDNYVMPACPTYFYSNDQVYTVTFLDADHKVLKTQKVSCGDEVVPPANPSWLGLTFKGWNKDFSDVHENMTVMALYDIDESLEFNTAMEAHKNNYYPTVGFPGAKKKAMIGDLLTFTADIYLMTESDLNLYYETATYDAGTDQFIWTAPTNNLVGTFSVYDSQHTKMKQFSQSVYVCYNPNTGYENPFQRRFAFRFYLVYHGTKVYSEPYEFDVYYNISFDSQLHNSNDPSAFDRLFTVNNPGASLPGAYINVPARYGDKVLIGRENGSGGANLKFKRVKQPTRDLETEVDKDGNAYIVCPGETEIIEVSARQRVVVFDGVYGNGYPKQFDFSAEGKGKFNGYYAQITDCGSSVTMPEDPTQEGYFFTGWKSWNDEEYPDNAYLKVPAGDDAIGFTAQWEEVPPVPIYTVRFLGKDGSVLKKQIVSQSDNAVPPIAPTIAGWTFVGWDKGYTNIVADTDITALYLDDNNKAFIVSYKDRIGAIDSDNIYLVANELVENGKSAKGTPLTRNGYEFVCWSLTLPYNDHTAADLSNITADIEVYAKWKPIKGDTDGDGKVDENDVKAVSDYILTSNANGIDLNAADLNGDGKVNAADLVLMISMMK